MEEGPRERECKWSCVSSSWPPPTLKWDGDDGTCGRTTEKNVMKVLALEMMVVVVEVVVVVVAVMQQASPASSSSASAKAGSRDLGKSIDGCQEINQKNGVSRAGAHPKLLYVAAAPEKARGLCEGKSGGHAYLESENSRR
jgi:hypothetical protein